MLSEEKLNELVELLLSGKEALAWNFIDEIWESRDSLYFFERILTRAMRRVGDLWENNDITVADEHVASNICQFLLSKHSVEYDFSIINQNALNRAMLFCIEGEEHSLGIKMASSLFKIHGWETRYLGANLPIKDSISYANKWRPEVIGISISIIYNLPKLVEFFKEIEQLDYKPEMIVGGRVTTFYDLERYLSEDTKVFRDLFQLNNWLVNKMMCRKQQYATR